MAASTHTTVHSPRTSLAHGVLCDAYMFRYITSFQQGFPHDIVTLARQNDTTFRPRGWLPALVMAAGDLRMLQRLYRLCTDQQAVYNEQSMLSFGSLWLDTLKAGQIEIAEWILAHDSIRSDHEPAVALRFAIASESVQVVEWLLQSGPTFQTAFTPEAIQDCPTLDMFLWLEANVKTLPSFTQLVDCAADHGRLELVRYVFSQYGACCTSRAVVGAASNAHLDVVRFLHENAHEQCSCNAMRAAAWHGHEAVVRYLNEHCSEAHGDAFELAALSGHLSIVMYLARTRTDVRVMRAHALVAQSGKNTDVKAYLSAILNPATHRNALAETSSEVRRCKSRCSLL